MTEGAKAFFEEHGYWLAKGVFDADEIRELEEAFDRIVEQLAKSEESIDATWGGAANEKIGATGKVVIHTHNVQRYSAAWSRALMHPKFLECATALLGPNVALHHSKLFQKPAGKGSPFPPHQDWSYFPTERDSMLAGVIHVSRADDAMGCLRVYPGSHKLGRMEDSDGTVGDELLERFPLDGGIALEAEPGDVAFFHYLTVHASKPNLSDETRKTVLVQLMDAADRVEDGITHTDEQLVLAGHNPHMSRSVAGRDR